MHSPFALQAVSLGFLIFFLTSFRPSAFIGGQEFFDDALRGARQNFPLSETGFLRNTSNINTLSNREVIIDETGAEVVKVVPQQRQKTVSYTVRSGDNISKIAHKFNLRVSTLLWANDLTARESLAIGQELTIPPMDGVFYAIKKGDTLSDIAKLHDISLRSVQSYNGLGDGSVLSVGKELFIPQAKKIYVPTRVAKTGSSASSKSTSKPSTGGIGSIGYKFIRPSRGVITQGYHRGHFALDIASKLNTPIYAAAAGKVIKSVNGWNYGYGKHVIVDHGDGVQTLYSHLNSRKIDTGSWVEAGQLIGLMGNTGNVYGPTGIHLHFELRIRGRKVNPLNYF